MSVPTDSHHPSILDIREEHIEAEHREHEARYAQLMAKPNPTHGDAIELTQLADLLGYTPKQLREHHDAIAQFVAASRVGAEWPEANALRRQIAAENEAREAEHEKYLQAYNAELLARSERFTAANNAENRAQMAQFRALTLRRKYPKLLGDHLLTEEFKQASTAFMTATETPRPVDVEAHRKTLILQTLGENPHPSNVQALADFNAKYPPPEALDDEDTSAAPGSGTTSGRVAGAPPASARRRHQTEAPDDVVTRRSKRAPSAAIELEEIL